MLHRIERAALHYDVTVTAAPSHAPVKPLIDILRELERASALDRAKWHRDRDRSILRVWRVRISNDGTRAVLLFHHTDIDAADPSFSALVTGRNRTEKKGPGEGVSVSAHLVIELTPDVGCTTYHAILEHVPGLTKSYIERTLQAVLRQIGGYQFREQNNTIQDAVPRITFVARLRENLSSDIARGRLTGVVLIRREGLENTFDNPAAMRLREATLRLDAVTNRTGAGALEQILSTIRSGRKDGYTNARLMYVDDDGRPRSTTVDIRDSDNFDAFVAKHSRFVVESDLAWCENEIRPDVCKQLDGLLRQHVASLAA